MELLDKLKQEYKEIIKICCNLSRQKASEILAFNICDTDSNCLTVMLTQI